MRRDKIYSGMFLLAILEVDPAQNLAIYKRWLRVLIQLNDSSIAIMKFMHSL